MYGMVAAGKANGGYDTLDEAMQALSKPPYKVYRPNPQHKAAYDALFRDYRRLSAYFGSANKDLMVGLKQLKTMAVEQPSVI